MEPVRWKDFQFIQEIDLQDFDEATRERLSANFDVKDGKVDIAFKEFDEQAKNKVKASIKENSFVQSFKVWQSPEGIIYCLDGFHRCLVLRELEQDGIQVPEEFFGEFIECKDKVEAAKLVLVYSSVYARVSQQGLNAFLMAYEIDYLDVASQIDLADFNHARYEQKFDVFDTKSLDVDEEEVLEENEEIIVQRGDIFQLNGHRILCGDSRIEENFATLMGNEKAHIVFTDPPYNIPYNFFGGAGNVQHDDFAMANGEMSDDEFAEFLRSYMRNLVKYTVPGSIHYHFMDFRHVWHVCQAAGQEDTYKSFEPKQICVWNKSVMGNGSFYRAKHEFCLIFKNGKAPHTSYLELQDRVRANVWDYPSANDFSNPDRKEAGEGIGELANHPTPKPTLMVADALLDTSNEGDTVIDCFLGGGATLIAAEKTNRLCRGIEYEPLYVQHIIKRYIRHCEKNGKVCEFQHLNGVLTIQNFTNNEPQ